MIALKCPRCRGRLGADEDGYRCSCGARYPVIDGIPVLAEATNYYGEIARERKEALLASMDRGVHWRELVWDHFGTSYPFLHHIIVDETRNDFRYFLPLEDHARVLDLGAGWGTMSCHFAAACKEVIALDGTLDRCRFIRKRCNQDGVTNVFPICANILDKPFPRESFDLIIMNGVLEWVGASRENRPPRDQQVEVLRIARGMLKKRGVLYIGIENSHGFKYILGEMDDHTGIYHISYLDREKANEKSLKELKRPYRTYTYDQGGYKDLLNAAGFDHARFLYPIPDYKSVEFLIPAEDSDLLLYYHRALNQPAQADSVRERIRSLETRAAKLGHAVHYAAGYGIVAGTSTVLSRAEKIRRHIMENWEAFLDKRPGRLRTLQISSTPGKVFEKGRIKHLLFAEGEQEPCLVAIFCRSTGYEDSLRKEFDFCRALGQHIATTFRVPEALLLPRIDGELVLVQRALHGKSLSWKIAEACLAAGGEGDSLMAMAETHFRIASACLHSLHRSEIRGLPGESLDRVLERIRRVIECMGQTSSKRLYKVAEEVIGLYEGLPHVPIHGDFTPWNLFVAEPGGDQPKPALIDWELAGYHPLTVLDYGRFAYYYLTDLERSGVLGCVRPEALRRVFVTGEHRLSSILQDFLREGLSELGREPLPISTLMQFTLLHDAALQMAYSAKPFKAVLPAYLECIAALEKED